MIAENRPMDRKLKMTRERALQVLDGLMLGDGGIIRYRNTACFYMNQSKHTISMEDHLKWLYWLRNNVFEVLGIEATVKLRESISRGKKYKCASLWTERSLLLAQIYDEWYVGGSWKVATGDESYLGAYYIAGATKIIPKRLMNASVLHKDTLVHWFLGDGGSPLYIKGGQRTVLVNFSTLCFTVEEVYHLMGMLDNMGLKTTKPSKYNTKRGLGLRIYLTQDSVDSFMSLVEPDILEIFGDSEGKSYKDMIKYRHNFAQQFSELRQVLSKQPCLGRRT